MLTIGSLSVAYDGVGVLRDLSLTVDRGDVLGIVGESGCGKTTLGLSVLGFLPPNARATGTVAKDGVDLLALGAAKRRKLLGSTISAVFQDPVTSLNPSYSVGNQIIEVLTTHLGWSRKRARDEAVRLLRDVGIASPETRLRAFPHELSGGMQQRVAIAIAVALEPDLVIADEPTSALDVTVQVQILRLLRTLLERRVGAIIVITHDLGVVLQLCNQVAVMYAGQIVEQAPAAELFRNPAHPYTRALLAALPTRDKVGERLPVIAGGVPDPGDLPDGCAFGPRCPHAMDRCLQPPPWIELADAHAARCVLHDGKGVEHGAP